MYNVSAADRAPTEAAARWVTEFQFDRAPQEVKQAVNLVLLDTLGVILASTRYPVGEAIVRGAQVLGADGRVVLPGTSRRLDVVTAALAYGTLGHGIELDEAHLPSHQHVGATVSGAALALSQHARSSLMQLRGALLVGYEVSGHLGVAIDQHKLLERGFHPSCVVSAFGCCAAAARLLGLTAQQTCQALGLTASQASGTIAWHTEPHHMSKSLQTGLAPRNGVTAALLAQSGYQGPLAVFAGPFNVCKVFSGADPDPDWVRGLGAEFQILNSSKKLYAAGRPMHAALDALLGIMQRESITARQIESIEVRMPPAAARVVDGNDTNAIDCTSVMAAAAIAGKFGLDQGTDSHMLQADVQALKQRIRLVHDDSLDRYFPRNWPAAVSIRCGDGRHAEETVIEATGDRQRPMSVEQLKDKFSGLAEPVVGKTSARQLIALLLSTEDARVEDLARLLMAPDGSARAN